jgi:hypothetical protein
MSSAQASTSCAICISERITCNDQGLIFRGCDDAITPRARKAQIRLRRPRSAARSLVAMRENRGTRGTKGGTEVWDRVVPFSRSLLGKQRSSDAFAWRRRLDGVSHSVEDSRRHGRSPADGALCRPRLRATKQRPIQPGRERPPSAARNSTPRPVRGGSLTPTCKPMSFRID